MRGTATPARPAPPPIDPRIRARRIEVARGEGRRRLRRVSAVAAAGAVVAAGWALALSPAFDVDHVRVAGAARTGPSAVAAAAGIERGAAMATLDLAAAADRVGALPWVAASRLRRDWPGTVRIEVVERVAVAAVPVAGGDAWMLVDPEGHQLETVEEVPPGVTRIEGAGEAGSPGDRLGAGAAGPLLVAAALSDALRPAVVAVAVDDAGLLTAEVALEAGAGAARVLLGPPEELEAKLVALEAVLAGADLADVQVIDVRVPSSPALTRGGGGG